MNRDGHRRRRADWSRALLGVASLLGISACATPYEVQQVRTDQKEVRGLLADLQVAVDKLKREVATLEADADQLQGRGRGGRPATNINDLEKRVAIVENRLKLIEQSQPAGAMVPAAPTGGTNEQPGLQGEPPPPLPVMTASPTPARAADSAVARDEAALAGATVDEKYREAFATMRRGKPSEAVPQFREFLRKNPKSDFADDAQFYIGECYYSTKDYNRAILEFNEVLLKYPKGEKVPPALLRQANAFAELGDKVDARLILQKLVGEYPKSEEAARAKQLLEQMGD